MVLHGNDGVHTQNRGSKDILGATTHYTPVMTVKSGTALNRSSARVVLGYWNRSIQITFRTSVETFFLISVHKLSMELRSGEFSRRLSTLTCCGGVFLAKAEVICTSCHSWRKRGGRVGPGFPTFFRGRAGEAPIYAFIFAIIPVHKCF